MGARFVRRTSARGTGHIGYFLHEQRGNQRPPQALLFVTPDWTPQGLCGCVSENGVIGVWYDDSVGKWAVFREDSEGMAEGETYNVLVVPKSSSSVFVHHASASNTSGDCTWINSKLTNDKPKAMLQVTQDWNPNDKGGTYNPHPIGVKYVKSRKRWAIFNEDRVAMTAGAAFNVMVGSGPSNGGAEKVLTTTSAPTSSGRW